MKDEKHFVSVKSLANGQSKVAYFTLIELLVVIAIIAILASMLLPALQKARESGKATTCKNNMKTAALAIRMYADSFNDHALPLHTGKSGLYDPYSGKLWMVFLKELGIVYNDSKLTGGSKMSKYMCPNVPLSLYTNSDMAFYSWAFNTKLGLGVPQSIAAWNSLIKMGSIKRPSLTLYMAETKNSPTNENPNSFKYAYNLYNVNPNATSAAWFDYRHNGMFNLIYFDGHVSNRTADGIKSSSLAKPNPFWKGE